ncbi:SigE family RNA polymerase sigma factor [Kribbella sp. NPDC056861]|uniref:SigE family RNA polymerase sigma factor n=1 Tax=Kribbella sp. NPDC056861 TaxID=3154857 RepID=UPI0034309225
MSANFEEFSDFTAARGTQMFRTAYLLAGDRHSAEDLLQSTLSKLFSVWGRFSKVENPDAYARTVMVRTYIADQRKTRREQPTLKLPDSVRSGEDTALRLTLLAALSSLPGRDRAIVVLRYWEDRSIQETAEILGLSARVVRTRCHRALAKLRDGLGLDINELSGL